MDCMQACYAEQACLIKILKPLLQCCGHVKAHSVYKQYREITSEMH